jgi:hypothetical protein
MPNSKSEKVKKWLKRIGWALGLAARFLPVNLRVWALALSTLAGGVVTLLDSRDKPKSPPASIPTPTASPSPIPTPTPLPLPELKAPKYVKASTPFWVELCNVGNVHNVNLYADNYRLGFMGFGDPCMRLNITLNQRGKRTLIAFLPDTKQVYFDLTVE